MKNKHNLILLFFFSLSLICKSDTWIARPYYVYFSENKGYKLVVTARKYPAKYFRWKMYMKSDKPDKLYKKEKRKFLRSITKTDTTAISCRGLFYRISGVDTVLVWDKPFPNEYNPVIAIISDDGSSVVTFDNFGSCGYGLNVMVVYNGIGNVVKSFKLDEISPIPLDEYNKSVSSLNWRRETRFIDNERIEIEFRNNQKQISKRIFNTKQLIFE